MRDTLLAQPKETPWVVATGALTNVALLFATFPEVVGHIRGLSVMGGAIGQKFTEAPMSRLLGEESRIGNVTPWAEFNIYVRLLFFFIHFFWVGPLKSFNAF
jgi:uridine nucleosidase